MGSLYRSLLGVDLGPVPQQVAFLSVTVNKRNFGEKPNLVQGDYLVCIWVTLVYRFLAREPGYPRA